MVKRQLVCNVFYNDESDDFYIGTASAIYCATGFPRPLNRSQMGALLKLYIETRMWNMVKANQTVPKDDFKAIREAAVNLAVEAIQVAAMAKKFEHGQRNNWPGAREDSHGEEKSGCAGSGNGDTHHEPTGSGSGKDGL